MDTFTLYVVGFFGIVMLGLFGLLAIVVKQRDKKSEAGGEGNTRPLTPVADRYFKIWAGLLFLTIVFAVLIFVLNHWLFAILTGICLVGAVVFRQVQVIARLRNK